MQRMKLLLHILAAFSVIYVVSSCSLDVFHSLYQKVAVKRNALADLVANASATGIDCSYEYITLNVSALFLQYSLYDINNTDILCEQYSDFYGENGCDIGKDVPCRELNKTLDILDKATMELEKLMQNPSLHRRPVPPHKFKDAKEIDGYFFNSTTMQPIFAGGYDLPSYSTVESDILLQLLPIAQDSHEVLLDMRFLFPSKGKLNYSEIDRIADNFDQLYTLFGLSSNLVMHCLFPDWVIESDPELKKYGGSNCYLNTDDPVVMDLWRQGLTPLVEKLKSNPAVNSYRLGNEVHFGVSYNLTAEVSEYTVAKWHQWLEDKYGNILKLNSIWKKSYSSFDQVYFPVKLIKKASRSILMLDQSLIGGPHFYDYCRFNGDRIFDYYSNISKIIKSVDPTAKTHIKYINHELFLDHYCNGVDRIALNSNLTEWSGCDTRITTAPYTFYNISFRNPGQYALDWLTPAIAYTWMRTTTPNKPVVDLETHPISTSNYRNTSIPDNHMSAVIWLTHLHGLALHKSWAWTRNANGSYRSYVNDIVDTYPTLPQAVDSSVRTIAMINALGNEVLALAKAPKPICMLWSRDSSIQDMNYLYSQVDTFEAVSFYGPQPQFIAEPLVQGPETFTNRDCKVLVIPGQSYVSDEIVDTVRSYVKDHNGKVIFTGSKTVFHFTPIGDARMSSELEWMKDLPHFPDQDPQKLLQAMEPYLAPANPDKIVTCIDQSTNMTVWGMLCRGAKMPNKKSTIAFVLNTLTVPVEVRLSIDGKLVATAKEIYMSEILDMKLPLKVEPLSVYILEID